MRTEAAHRLLLSVPVVLKLQRAYLRLELIIVAYDKRPQDPLSHIEVLVKARQMVTIW